MKVPAGFPAGKFFDMSTKIKVKGIVIREQTVGESDKLVWLLTAEQGIIKAFVKKAKSVNNKNSVVSLFVYGDFSLYKGKSAYNVEYVKPIEVFFDLRKDLFNTSLAQYFAELSFQLSQEDSPSEEILRVLLNALYALCNTEKNIDLIKAATEMRMVSLSGYMPDILACQVCGKYESDIMYFSILEGCIFCDNCNRGDTIAIPLSVIKAIRHICLTDVKKIYSFYIGEKELDLLSQLCEKYVLSILDYNIKSLKFYKGLF